MEFGRYSSRQFVGSIAERASRISLQHSQKLLPHSQPGNSTWWVMVPTGKR